MTGTKDKGRATMDIPEVARRLGIGRNQAYEAARSGLIPTIRVGKRVIVPTAAFERFLEAEPKGGTRK